MLENAFTMEDEMLVVEDRVQQVVADTFMATDFMHE